MFICATCKSKELCLEIDECADKGFSDINEGAWEMKEDIEPDKIKLTPEKNKQLQNYLANNIKE